MKIFKKLYNLLTIVDQYQFKLLLIAVLFMSLIDMIGIASIMPFIALLTNPQLIDTNIYLNNFFQITKKFGITNSHQFLIFTGFFAFLMLILSLLVKMIASYLQFRFINNCEFNISKKLMESYLHQPYSWFLNRNSADLGKNVLSEIAIIIEQGINPLIVLITYSCVSIALLTLLIIINPIIAFTAILTIIIGYGIVFKFVKNTLTKHGKERLRHNRNRFIAITEAFGATKAIKIGNLENFFIQRFAIPGKIYAKNQASIQIISTLPRFCLEAIAFGGMIVLILILMSVDGDFSKVIAIISVYAFAGYRLMPALQQIYWSISQLRFSKPALEKLDDEIKSLKIRHLSKQNLNSLSLTKNIILKSVYYTYPSSFNPVLKNINIKISANSIVGIAGSTGSGKTTLIDIILGLLESQEGQLIIDDTIINDFNRKEWQNLIGYVPQNIYLSDDTISSNIAYGVHQENIDKEAVISAAKIANIHDFIKNDLADGYDTKVGDRGARLSGGQVQRIGVARALYHKPKVLIFDEATSALDSKTEETIMKEIFNLHGKFTIILVAHRLNTLLKCNQLYFIDDNKIAIHGTFDYLKNHNIKFREMFKLTDKDSSNKG